MSVVATAPRTFRSSFSSRLSDFAYEYPKDLVARYPAAPRDSARMMVIDRSERTISHRRFSDIVDYFEPGDALVVNDTKVFSARLSGQKEKTGARVEVFLLRELNQGSRLWDALVHPARKVRVGNMIAFSDDLAVEVVDNTTNRGRTIRFVFDGSDEALYERIEALGTTPIPPYLRRPVEPSDREAYQSIFARHRGAVAAPCAGLHFTPALVDRLIAAGVDIVPITMHVGLGTFRPVEVEDLSKHQMDSENYLISQEAAARVNRVLETPGSIVTACSTTCVRALESSISASGMLKAGVGWTDKFIYPPYQFRIAQRLITNFHLPASTLLMLVSAFADRELVMHAYEEAVREEYRLLSYGDAMLIL